MDEWTWGELRDAVAGWQKRRREEMKDKALMLFRYGMTFTPGKFQREPKLWEVFPFWTDEEVLEMEMAQAEAQMEALAASE